ncbi:MAG: hypothetical protein R3E88_00895 [Myxococcota bacterium]
MSSVKRGLALVAAVAGLTFAAGSAHAASAIDFVWLSSGTPTVASPAASSTITGAFRLTGEDPGMWLIVFTLQFDTVELDFVNATEMTNVIGAPMNANSIGPITSGVNVDEMGGVVNQLDWQGQFTNLTGCATGCVITLGTIQFRVASTGATGDGLDRDIRLGEFSVGLDGTYSGMGVDLPATYGDGAVLPEPMSAAFGAAALGVLGLIARRRA